MDDKGSSIAIIIVNWNAYELTRKCLLSLREVTYKNLSVYLVDNGSVDRSGLRLQEEFTELIHISNNENLGFTGGNNVAIERALNDGHEYIMLLNNDTEVTSDFIEPLVKRVMKEPLIAAVQPLILDLNHKSKIWNAGGDFNKFIGKAKTRLEGRESTELIKQNPYTDWITGCCILVRSSVLNEIGLLNNKFFAYHEDVDWSVKMTKGNYKLGIVYESIIYHLSMASLKSKHKNRDGFLSPFMHYLQVRNHLFLIRIHSDFFNPIGSWSYQLIKFVGYMGYFILRGRFKKLSFAFRGFRDGISK
jgi:hypothetical protein